MASTELQHLERPPEEMSKHELRLVLEELYADYVDCLDGGRYEDWPSFFTEDCLYRIVPRENQDKGLPIATVHCEGRGYLVDRVQAIRNTSVYAPRYMRRMMSNIRIVGWKDGLLEVRVRYAAFETLLDQLTQVFSVGEHRDRIAVRNGELKFHEKLVIFDSELVPNSLIYPL
jgi:3-phenylpropionate/cinnamic acid dioxygenase small subunit